jgi:AraC family transcriptional regulator of arabinose operon
MTYTIAGHGRYRLGRTELLTDPGDVVLVRDDVPIEHSVPGPDEWDYCYLRFDPWPEWSPEMPFERVADGLYRAHVRLVPTRQRIEDAFRRLMSDLRARDAAATLTDIRGASRARRPATSSVRSELALMALREILLLVGEDPLESGRLDPRILGALQIVTDDLAAHHDVASLARTAGLSVSRFLHLFREQVGLPPGRAIRLLRLQQAALRLVYTNDAVGTIAEETGFASIFDLSRQFRWTYGVSPRAYRERSRTPSLPPRPSVRPKR